MSRPWHPASAAVRAGIESDDQFGAVVPPIHLSTNFTFEGFEKRRTYDYTRSGNPTRDLLAKALAELEGGAGAVITSSGMSAITLVLQLLRAGDRLVAPHDAYGGTWRALRSLAEKGNFELRLVDLTNPDNLKEVAEWGPRMIWVETPSNPLLRLTDLEAVGETARQCGALLVVDNTFLSPLLQRPFNFGADVVLHSTTKYINGHSDVVGGVAIGRTVELHEQLDWWGNCLGLTGAPLDSYLTLRGLRTMHLRIQQHEKNAQAAAEFLARSPLVKQVNYPGLTTHPDHDLAVRQQKGFGGMLSFELHPSENSVAAFLDGLRLFSLAESLGGVESLIAHPVSMTHSAMSADALAEAGINKQLLRLSMGIEATEDLVSDLEEGLARVSQRRPVPKPAHSVSSPLLVC